MFKELHFQAFDQMDAQEALHHIRRYIQPQLRKYGHVIHEAIIESTMFDQLPVHVAKHIRRKVTPPFNTWVSIGGDGRGYKKYGHVQLGMNQQYVFLVLALIDHPPYESEILSAWKAKGNIITSLPEDFVFIFDHTDYPWVPLQEITWTALEQRSQISHKADIMIGRLLERATIDTMTEASFQAWMIDTLHHLVPWITVARKVDLQLRHK